MLCLSTIEPSTLELLKKLQQLPELRDTRLVGGTALALQLGHRKSIDLDFFGTINCDTQELVDAIKSVATLTILKESPHIHIYLIDGIKVDIVNYKYPWLDEVVLKQEIRMASFKDIAAMKITAVVATRHIISVGNLITSVSVYYYVAFKWYRPRCIRLQRSVYTSQSFHNIPFTFPENTR